MPRTVKLSNEHFKRGVEDVFTMRPIVKAVKSAAASLKAGPTKVSVYSTKKDVVVVRQK